VPEATGKTVQDGIAIAVLHTDTVTEILRKTEDDGYGRSWIGRDVP
jgi:hypothetical protein